MTPVEQVLDNHVLLWPYKQATEQIVDRLATEHEELSSVVEQARQGHTLYCACVLCDYVKYKRL